MWHDLVGDESAFFLSLIACDEQLAAAVRQRGCPCGGRLDRADYPRKPRGVPAAWDEAFGRRISFCCDKEGCRKRCTPPSVRFFGRRVYVAAVMVVVCALRTTARRAGVPRNTARRWRRYFRTGFVRSSFWQAARARLVPAIEDTSLVAGLLSRFGGDGASALRGALRFISPVTTKSAGGLMAV